MARPESGKRVMGWAAAATLLAATPLMAACSDDSHSSSSHSSSPSPSASTSADSGGVSGGGSGAQAGDQSTVSSTVAAWVTAIIEKDAKQACLLSTAPGNSSPPKPTTPQLCNAPSTQKKLAPGLKSLSQAFAPQHASGKPKVRVDAPTPQGDEAVVPAAKIFINGKSLRAIMLSRSHGVNAKSFTVKVKTNKINDKWYVGDFDLGGGGQTLQPQRQ